MQRVDVRTHATTRAQPGALACAFSSPLEPGNLLRSRVTLPRRRRTSFASGWRISWVVLARNVHKTNKKVTSENEGRIPSNATLERDRGRAPTSRGPKDGLRVDEDDAAGGMPPSVTKQPTN